MIHRSNLKQHVKTQRYASFVPARLLGVVSLALLALLDTAPLPIQASVAEAWTRSYNGGQVDGAFAMGLDLGGNVYVTGYSATNNGSDFVTMKYSPDGLPLWSRRYGGSGADEQPAAIAVSPAGDSWVTGISRFSGQTAYATVHYDPDGNVLWTRHLEGLGYNAPGPAGVAVDRSGNAYVGGVRTFGSELRFLVAKYSANGTELWVRSAGNNLNSATRIALDSAGNLILTGNVSGTQDYQDILTAKFDPAGNLLWTARYDGNGNHESQWASGLEVDADENIYVAGGASDGFGSSFLTLKYSPAGNLLWASSYQGPSGVSSEAGAVKVDPVGNVYVTGASTFRVGDRWASDFSTVKYDPDGVQLWVARYPWQNPGGHLWYGVLGLDDAGSLYVGGSDSFATLKYAPDGYLVWAVSHPSGFARDLVVDAAGNVYRAGQWVNPSPPPVPSDYYDLALIKFTQTDVPSRPTAFVSPSRPEAIVGSNVILTTIATGAEPLTYQWRFNGQRIATATNPALTLVAAQLVQAGDYSVVVSNAFGYTISPETRLTLHVPAAITSIAQTNKFVVGDSNTWTVTAEGEGPLSYRWLFNGVAIPGATGAALTMANLQTGASGVYTMIVSNAYGVAVSQPFVLTVVPVSVQLSSLGSWPGYDRGGQALDVKVVDDRAYLAMGRAGLVIFDVSNPAAPVRLGGYVTGRIAHALHVVGDLAYVVLQEWSGPGSLEIIDISAPGNPVRVGGHEITGNAYDVCVAGGHAYVADGSAGLQVIDVSDPAHPRRVGGYANTYPVAVQVNGNYAYVANVFTGLEVIDRRDPAHPVRVGGYGTDLRARDVRVMGNDVYLTVQTWTGSDYEGTLKILDASDPAHPILVGERVTTGSAEKVQVEGGYAYVLGLRSYHGTLDVINVGNPASPLRMGGLPVDGYSIPGGFHVVGTRAYVAANYQGLQVIDLSLPTNPVQVSGGDTSGSSQGVRVVGRYAYLADGTAGLQIVDVNDPANPIGVGHYSNHDFAQDVEVADGFAYLACRSTNLLVLDIRDPSNPVPVGRIDTGGCASGANVLQVIGTMAWLVDGSGALQAIDLSDPAQLVRVAEYPIRFAQGLKVVNQRAYVVGNDDDDVGFLQILDVTQPTNIRSIAVIATGDYAAGVEVAGDHAYVSGYGPGLAIFDVSNPAAPLRVSQFNREFAGWQAAQRVSDYAYVVGGSLLVLDVSDPTVPFRVAEHTLGPVDDDEGSKEVQVVGNRAYVAGGYAGLRIFDVDERPRIRGVIRSAGQLTVWWNGAPGLRLQRSSSMTNPAWTDVPGSQGQGQIELPIGGDTAFFRLSRIE